MLDNSTKNRVLNESNKKRRKGYFKSFNKEQLERDFQNNPDFLRHTFYLRELLGYGQNFLSKGSPNRVISGNIALKTLHSVSMKGYLDCEIEKCYDSYQKWIEYLHGEREKNIILAINVVSTYIFYSENIIYWMAKISNPIISIAYIKDSWSKGTTVDQIEIDCIGKLIDKKNPLSEQLVGPYFSGHTSFLEKLNNFHNANKHSITGGFLESIPWDGGDPFLVYYRFKQNDFSENKKPERELWYLYDIIESFEKFYSEVGHLFN